MKRILHLIPHLSTGGCPQFAYDLLRKTKDTTDAYVVEYAFIAWDYVVQRNRIIDLMKDADEIKLLKPFCILCQKNNKISKAIYTKLLSKSNEDKVQTLSEDESISFLIGKEEYAPVCRECFKL